MTPLSPRCTCAHFLSTCSRLASWLATRLRLAHTWPTVAHRPYQHGAWQGRVESRSPRGPLLLPLFAMPGAPLFHSSHFAQHALCVPTPLSTAMHETLYWPAAALSATQTKFQDRAAGQLRKGPHSLWPRGGMAGALQERELGAVGLWQDVRASVFTENCKVQVAQRTARRRNTLQVGAG